MFKFCCKPEKRGSTNEHYWGKKPLNQYRDPKYFRILK